MVEPEMNVAITGGPIALPTLVSAVCSHLNCHHTWTIWLMQSQGERVGLRLGSLVCPSGPLKSV